MFRRRQTIKAERGPAHANNKTVDAGHTGRLDSPNMSRSKYLVKPTSTLSNSQLHITLFFL